MHELHEVAFANLGFDLSLLQYGSPYAGRSPPPRQHLSHNTGVDGWWSCWLRSGHHVHCYAAHHLVWVRRW